MLINRLSLLVLLVALLALASAPIYERMSWRGRVPEKYRDAEEIVSDETATGSLESDSDERYYVLRARAGRLYTLDLSSDDFDPELRVEVVSDGKASFEGSDDDGGEDTDARYSFCGSTEDVLYVIEVASVSDEGTYELRVGEEVEEACVEGQPFQARLPAEFRRMPRVVTAGAPENGRISGSPDHWILEAAPEHLYTVDVTSTGMDPALEVYSIRDRASNLEGDNDDAGDGTDARFAFCSGDEAGLYVLAVRGIGDAEGNYALAVEDGGAEACRGGEAARSQLPPANAGIAEVRPGVTGSGVLATDERVLYLLATLPGREYEVTLEAGGFDAYLRIYRALAGELNEISSDDDSGGDRNAQLTFCAEAGGAWVAEASSFGGSGSGSFSLRMIASGSC